MVRGDGGARRRRGTTGAERVESLTKEIATGATHRRVVSTVTRHA
ncbi:MAG: hypothetical protein AVDCRST_MAG19-2316 [uncultured Thermomicrobiales bacterium]|uniref:Uncharacterized protein n=1 Tax=uncultured Thermomicrobiales bacterium TaxID=1645740 RepID=A0A6J4V7W0_9BACT|nr:MAG: hypothetical protein AVDCRST_MAG19-2316 [uncultured Thermomicrobiales bacterium]